MASPNTLKHHPKAPHKRTLERPLNASAVLVVREGYGFNGRGDLLNLAKGARKANA